MDIRPTTDKDMDGIHSLYPVAFPDEDLWPLVRALLALPEVLSLAAFENETLVGHILFTMGRSATGKGKGALLGPLGVVPGMQNRGVGQALVHKGFELLIASDVAQVFVLGDPQYYGRFGFAREPLVKPPYPIPEAWSGAWQSLVMAEKDALDPGPLILPEAWMAPELWAP